MVKFLVERPIAVLVSLTAFLTLGVITARQLPVSLLPDVAIPEMTARVSNPSMNALELENTVVRRMRAQLLQVHQLKKIDSRTRDGSSRLRLRFAYGTDIDYAFMEVNERVDAMMDWLPRDMERPRVIKASASDIPVYNLSVTYKNPGQQDFLSLSEFSRQIIRRRIEQLNEVALADLSGTVEPRVVIRPDGDKMQSHALSNDDLVRAFQNQNTRLGSVTLRDGYYQYAVNVSTQTSSVKEIENIALKSGDRMLSLGDVAEVDIEPQEIRGEYRINDRKGIVLSIIKKKDARIQELDEGFRQRISQLRSDYPHLEFTISRDQTQLLNASISNLQQNLLYGFLLAFLVMFIVLKSFRSPLLMGITIPASIIISMLVFYLAGLSINIVFLSGLILGAGMMIDNSIIVIDNITQFRRRGNDLLQACVRGTNEVIRPLISSVLTTCAVFVPLVFLSDISGVLFFDQAVAIAVGLSVSLLVSVMVIPVLYHTFHRQNKEENILMRRRISLIGIYERGLKKVYTRKGLFFLLFMLLIPAGYFLYQEIDKKLTPEITRNDFRMHIDWNERIPVDENASRCQTLYDSISSHADRVTFFVGQQQFMLNRGYDNSIPETDMIVTVPPSKLKTLEEKAKDFVARRHPKASLEVFPVKNVFEALFATSQPDLTAKVRNRANNRIPEKDTLVKLRETGDLFVKSQHFPLKETITIRVNLAQLYLYDVAYEKLIGKLETEIQANRFDEVTFNQRLIPVTLSSGTSQLTRILKESYVSNREGKLIPLRSLINIAHTKAYKTVMADRQGKYVPMVLNTKDKAPARAATELEKAVKDFPGLTYTLGGTWLRSKKMNKELMYVLAISLLLLYFILAAQFESLAQPLIVLFEVFIDVAGALLLLNIFGVSLNVMSAIGIIVMSGIIINDSIIKVDTINRLRREGYAVADAVFEAGLRRFNPIMMTSMTTILALLPLFFTTGLGVELQAPLAISVIGGMILGTVVSLYFIPAFYGLIYQRNKSQ